MSPATAAITLRSALARRNVASVVVPLMKKSVRCASAYDDGSSCIMRPPKPLPANVVLNNTRPVLATATENGLSLMKFDGTVTFCCSTPAVRSTMEMLLPPEFATYSVVPSGLTSRPVGCEPTAIGVWSSSSAIENTSTRLLVAFVRYTCSHVSSKITSVRVPVTATARGVANPTAHAACARAGDASNHAAARYGSADASRRRGGEMGDMDESPLLRT